MATLYKYPYPLVAMETNELLPTSFKSVSSSGGNRLTSVTGHQVTHVTAKKIP